VVQVLDLDQVLTRIVSEAIRMLKVETGSVLLLDENTTELTFATSISNGKRVKISTRLQPNQGIAGWVMANGEPACVNDVELDPRWFGEVETGFVTHSLLCVPLRLNGRVLGVIQVLNKKAGGFDSGDIARLSAFASSATIALENARLFQEASQARQLSALNEVALALSSTLDLATILDTGLTQAIELLKAEAGAIILLNGYAESEPFPNQVSRGRLAQVELTEQQWQALRTLAQLSLELGNQALIIDDRHPAQDPASLALLATDIQALALTSIKTGYEVRGGLAVIQTGAHTFTDDELNLLISLARIIGLAAQNAIHYHQMRTQTMHLAYLNEVGSALISSLHLDHVLKVIIQGVNALLETERTSVFLIDAATNELVLRYSNEGNANIRLPAPWQGIAGWVASHDQPALVNDTLSDPRHLRAVAIETSYQAHSILAVPLKVEGKVIGVVEVLNKTDGQQFTHYHQIMLVEFVRWAAIAIHNARLFDEKVQAFERLATEQQRRIVAETRGAMAAVILDMAHTMNNIVGAIRVWASNLESQARLEPGKSLGEFSKEVEHIRQNAEEAIRLIANMTGPLQQAELTPTDVHRCLAAAIKSCWWPDHISLKRDYGTDIPPVKANAKRLETVFHNLLSNAVQALAQQRGEIRLQTRRLSTGQVEVSVSDNGPGIPFNLQSHLFNPGVSGTEGGLGIGLWLVETFVHQFDGQIDFTSSQTQGTTFVVTLQPMRENKDRRLDNFPNSPGD
ncbi:MAG: GAF domain-containing protein, partial [Chloroflexota bacterium]